LTDKSLTMTEVVALIDAREEKALADKRRAVLVETNPCSN
jgi:hypothetical protein